MQQTDLDRGVAAASVSEADEIRQQQIVTLRRRAPALAAISVVNAVITAVVLAPQTSPWLALAWAAGVSGLALHPIGRWVRKRSAAPPRRVGFRALGRATRNSALIGLAWGLGAFLLFPFSSPQHQLFLAMVMAGMVGGAAIALAPLPRAAMACALAMALPTIARFALQGGEVDAAIAAMMGMYLFGMLAMSHSAFRIFLHSVRIRYANATLVRDLAAARTDLMDAISNTSEGLALFDDRDRLVVSNARFSELWGLPPERPPGAPGYEDLLRDASPPAGLDRDGRGFEVWLRQETTRHREAAGSHVYQIEPGVWLKTSHRRTDRGGIVTTLSDVTAMKAEEQELYDAKVEAETANRAKSDFLAMMSHELRTPLNAILGFAEIIRDGLFGLPADPRYGEYAGDIHASAHHLLHVINDILDLSKIESGKYELAEEPVDLVDLLESVRRMMAERARQAGLTLAISMPGDLPALTADARAVKQMLVNLISNSIKFTPTAGRVTIAARVQDGELVLEIADNGIGIAPADLPKVFEPFSQIDGGHTRARQGTGLGVPLVKSLMERHGGRLRLASEPGAGTTAELVFPAERTAPPARATAPSRREGAA